MKRSFRGNGVLALGAALALLVGACGDDADKSDAAADVEETVRGAVAAENAKDADTFLALWTDKGLEEYDVGSRSDVRSGNSENFGTDTVEILRISDTKVDGDTATTTVDATVGEAQIVPVVNQVSFSLVKKDSAWLLDGFDFRGGPAPGSGVKTVKITAQEYAFSLESTQLSPNTAFSFVNLGQEAHEITLFKAPDEVDLMTAKAALEGVDGQSLENIPVGYRVDHVSFAEPGETQPVTFKDALPDGKYVLACYIPEGGLGDEGPVNPEGKPHIQVGMISLFTIA